MTNSTIMEYANEVKAEIEARIEDVDITIHEINKNGVKLTALTIRPNGLNVGVNVYVNDFYEVEDVKECASKMIEIYENNKSTEGINVDSMSDYNLAKEMLRVMLVNTERNNGIGLALKEVAGMDGLSYLPYIEISSDEIGMGIIKITTEMLDVWGVDIDEVLSQATLNQIDCGYSAKSMFDTLREMMGVDDLGFIPEDNSLVVVTNKYKTNGAIEVILHGAEIERKMGGDYVVIPCSRHEVICLPFDDKMTPGEIRDLVENVNSTEVSAEDYLSDNVYAYVNGEFKTIA